MPNYAETTETTLIRGLVTEAGEMSFPEKASIDELNCDLFRDGTRRRRRAFQLETNSSLSSFSVTSNNKFTFGDWSTTTGESFNQYLVVQVGSTLHFYDKTSIPFSGQEFSNQINLSPFQISGKQIADYQSEFASIKGFLVVVNEAMEPIYIEETSKGVFTATQINPKIRDFEWLGDRTTYDEKSASSVVTSQREYDTLNCGWVSPGGDTALSSYTSSRSAYPPLTHRWYSGKDSSGNFSISEWEKVFSGTTLLGNGHFILDLFSRDRSTVSGVSGIATDEENTRFTAVESFSSRVFFSGLKSKGSSGKVFFSPIIDDIQDISVFHQRNDPTAEDFSDLLDTDGGVIVIPDATEIRKLYGFRNSIFVFADNGVWQITGVDNAFTASAYSISRISTNGIITPKSFVAAEGVPFWWSRYGIHTLSFNEFGSASEENISISTIQTFWNEIESSSKEEVQAVYDSINKKIVWMYPDNGETISNRYSRFLILDIALQAFYPWKIGGTDSYVLGASFYPSFSKDDQTFDVVVQGEPVLAGGEEVVATIESPVADTLSIVFLVRSENAMTMAFSNSNLLRDWGSESYSSFMETGHTFLGSSILKKTAPYIVTYCRKTENSAEARSAIDYSAVDESSILVSAFWDFRTTPASSPQQAYRLDLPFFVDPNNLTEPLSASTVVASRLKLRGRGRSLRLKFESEGDKDFILIGYGMITDAASRF